MEKVQEFSVWIVILPWDAAVLPSVRAEMDWFVGAHMLHGSLRFSREGVVLTSEMIQDYPDFRRAIQHLVRHLPPSEFRSMFTQIA
jgi:hypothetical protein